MKYEPELTSLRGLSALWVFIFHAILKFTGITYLFELLVPEEGVHPCNIRA